MKLEGRILLFDTVNLNKDIFPKDCKITIPEKLPLTWQFDQRKPIGFAEVSKDDKGLVATAETFPDDYIGVKDIREILTDGKIGAGGYYNKVKRHNEGNLTVIDEATLRAIGLVLAPVREEYSFEIIEEA